MKYKVYKTNIIFSNPIKYYDLFVTENDVNDIKIEIYTACVERHFYEFIKIVDGNHRVAGLIDRYGEEKAKYLLKTKAKILKEKEVTNLKDFISFMYIANLQNRIIEKYGYFGVYEFEQTIKQFKLNCDNIDNFLEQDNITIDFLYLYIYSDQTEGSGEYIKGVLEISKNKNNVIVNFTGIESPEFYNNYNSEHFRLLSDEKLQLRTITKRKEFTLKKIPFNIIDIEGVSIEIINFEYNLIFIDDDIEKYYFNGEELPENNKLILYLKDAIFYAPI